jgi:uncharacterized XkdX family phage protein
MWFETIKRYYEKGIYNDEHLNKFVSAGMITEEQMQEIIASKEVAK